MPPVEDVAVKGEGAAPKGEAAGAAPKGEAAGVAPKVGAEPAPKSDAAGLAPKPPPPNAGVVAGAPKLALAGGPPKGLEVVPNVDCPGGAPGSQHGEGVVRRRANGGQWEGAGAQG